MKEPCRSCPDRFKDFGGCRCQAFQLAGDPAAADPVCSLSADHGLVVEAVNKADQAAARLPAEQQPLVFRNARNSKALAG